MSTIPCYENCTRVPVLPPLDTLPLTGTTTAVLIVAAAGLILLGTLLVAGGRR